VRRDMGRDAIVAGVGCGCEGKGKRRPKMLFCGALLGCEMKGRFSVDVGTASENKLGKIEY